MVSSGRPRPRCVWVVALLNIGFAGLSLGSLLNYRFGGTAAPQVQMTASSVAISALLPVLLIATSLLVLRPVAGMRWCMLVVAALFYAITLVLSLFALVFAGSALPGLALLELCFKVACNAVMIGLNAWVVFSALGKAYSSRPG
jgi:hypothetical protein